MKEMMDVLFFNIFTFECFYGVSVLKIFPSDDFLLIMRTVFTKQIS